MSVDSMTFNLLSSVLETSSMRRLFSTIADMRIAKKAPLQAADNELDALVGADLIGSAPDGDQYYVTAKGLKVARDLERLAIR